MTLNHWVVGSSPTGVTEQNGKTPQIAETKAVSAIFVMFLSGRIKHIVGQAEISGSSRILGRVSDFCPHYRKRSNLGNEPRPKRRPGELGSETCHVERALAPRPRTEQVSDKGNEKNSIFFSSCHCLGRMSVADNRRHCREHRPCHVVHRETKSGVCLPDDYL